MVIWPAVTHFALICAYNLLVAKSLTFAHAFVISINIIIGFGNLLRSKLFIFKAQRRAFVNAEIEHFLFEEDVAIWSQVHFGLVVPKL